MHASCQLPARKLKLNNYDIFTLTFLSFVKKNFDINILTFKNVELSMTADALLVILSRLQIFSPY